jgi:hypothetical protein
VHVTPVHEYEYGPVPPDGLAVNVTDWPLSIVGADGETTPTESALLTVIWSFAVTVAGEDAESFTCTVAIDVEVGDVVHVCEVCPSAHVTPVHKYEYGEAPPEGLAVNFIDWPRSIAGSSGTTVPTESVLDVTVTMSVAVAVTWLFEQDPSLTSTQ